MGRLCGWFVHTTCRRSQNSIIITRRDHLEYVVRLQFQMTNNEAKYEALLQGLENSVLVQGDSQLVINQVNEMCEAKEERMKKYLGKVKQCIKGFTTTRFQQIPMEENVEANVLAKAASVNEMVGN